jgi:uncharacterized protein YhaN
MIFKEIYIDGFGVFDTFNRSLSKGVNIIVGCNEAGKSTLQKFFRFTLFGYPNKTDERMSPIKFGPHGGRIKAKLLSEEEVMFERISGSKGGDITLTYNNTESKNPALWFQLLGNATKDLYNNVYAFSLDELINLDSLSSSGVEDKIFSIGLGLGNASIGTIESNIQGVVDLIYLPKGKGGQEIPKILSEIQSKKLSIQQIQNNLTTYQTLLSDIEEIKINIIPSIESDLKAIREEYDKLNDYLKCYESFFSITNIDKQLKTLPEIKEYPLNGIEQLNKLKGKEEDFENRIKELQIGNKGEKGITEIVEKINTVTFNSELLESGNKVEYLKKNFEKYKQTLKDKNDDDKNIESINEKATQEIKKISDKWTEANIVNFSNLISHRDKIEIFKRRFKEVNDKRIDLEAEQKFLKANESKINIKTLIITISIILIFCSLAAFYYAQIVLGILFLLIVLILIISKKFLIKEKTFSKIQNDLIDLENKEGYIKKDYDEYLLQILNLDTSLLPESVFEIFRMIEQLNKDLGKREELNKKQTERYFFLQEYERETESIKYILSNITNESLEFIVNRIIIEFDTSKNQSENKKNLQELLERKNKELNTATTNLQQIQGQIIELLNSISANNKNDFISKYEENKNVKELMNKRNISVDTIEKIAGLNKYNAVKGFWESNEKNQVEKDKTNLENKLKTKNEENNSKNLELGEKKTEVKRIEGESELALVLTELETEKQKLNNKYSDWVAGKIALKILEKVKEKYEIEKQPNVIKNSSIYFSKITNEKYKRISASLEDKDVSVFDSNERSKKLHQLSRGTKEQLLVSLRLGFIEEYEKTAEPLPLIVDEVLVNFDSTRANRTAKILHEFAENRQILIFTCHASTKDYFEDLPVNLIEL